MTNLHPKLNWENFQKVRARRKRKKWLLWFTVATTVACLTGFLFVQYNSPLAPPIEEQATALTPEVSDSAALPANAEDLNKKENKSPIASQKLKKSISSNAENTLYPVEISQVPSNISSSPLPEITAPLNQTNTPIEAAAATPEFRKDFLPIQKIDVLNPALLDRRELYLTFVPYAAPTAPISTAFPQPKDVAVPRNFALWLSLAWSPWHSREFRLPVLPPETELNYQPLQSASLALRLELATFNKMVLSVEPQYNEQRFQVQYSGQFESSLYAPGSVVGYLQTFKGFEPIYADSLQGTTTRMFREDGAQREFTLPVSVSMPLFSRGPIELLGSASLGLHYRAQYRGSWLTGEVPYSLNNTASQLGFLASGGLSMQYQPHRIRYSCSWITAYRSTIRPDQLPLRNQVLLSISLPLLR